MKAGNSPGSREQLKQYGTIKTIQSRHQRTIKTVENN